MKIDICDNPIFVLGPPRSGTSMLQWALRQHSNLWGGQESDYLTPLTSQLRDVWEFGRTRERFHWLSGQDVGWDEFVSHIGIGINALYMSRSGGLRWVEQTPQYTLHLDNILRLFPGAQFLFMVRDGREVVHSLRNFVNPVEHRRACAIWRDFIGAGVDFSRSPRGGQLHFVSFAGAVHETATELRNVCEFLEEGFEQGPVDFITTRDPINSSFAADEPQKGAGPRWASWTAEELVSFTDIAGDLLIQMGFENDHSWADSSLDTPTS